jgi:hypothetical protein
MEKRRGVDLGFEAIGKLGMGSGSDMALGMAAVRACGAGIEMPRRGDSLAQILDSKHESLTVKNRMTILPKPST